MDAIGTLVAGIKHVDQLIDEEVLEPDPGRDDWPGMKARVALVDDAVEQELLGALTDALAEAESEEVRTVIRRRVSALIGAAAALRIVSGNHRGGVAWAEKAAKMAVKPEERSELEAAGEDPAGFVLLWHGRWLQEHGRRPEADRVMKGVVKTAKAEALRAAAKTGLRAPRPMTSAPPLFRLNGCGVSLYGERDRRPDGSYIATYCVCLLFIPVFPLTAYRVRDAGDNRYQFGSHEFLSPLMRGVQIAMLSLVVLVVGWNGFTSWRGSSQHQASIALDEAKAAEASGDREGAIARYNATIRRFVNEGDVYLDPAVEAVIRLSSAGVIEPCTAASVETIGRVVNAYYELPENARQDRASTLLTQRLTTWAGQIGEATAKDAEAALTVLDLGARVARVATDKAAIEARRIQIRRALADRIAGERPLRALRLYTEGKSDPASLAQAKTIIESFGEAPSLWLEAEREVEAWLAAAGSGAKASGFKEKLGKARARHVEDEATIEAGDEKKLAKALAAAPQDQELAVGLAAAQRRRGDVKAALATLSALGPPGRMTSAAQQLLAACSAESGDLAKADAVLTAFLADRLAPFQQAQRDYTAAMSQLQTRLIADARADRIDPDLRRKLVGASESDQPRLFREWMAERMDADPELTVLRSDFMRHGAVVGASLSLGTIELRRANDATGEERKALLGSAEKVFLAIRQEAEGDPTFHLGLGQVLHRLGRTEDGNVELGHVLEKKDPGLTLEVVSIYRDLALPIRAKEIAEELYAASATPVEMKQRAAGLLAHLVNEVGFNEDDEEMWLKRADQEAEGPKAMLLGLEARRLRRDGKNAEADRAYARIAAIYERDAKHNPTSANNAALSYLDRFRVSGDPAQLHTGLQHLENARRLASQNAMVLGNLGEALELQGLLKVLERWVRARTLLLDGSSARSVLGTLLAGPLHAEVVAALKQDASLHRCQELRQEEQTLAPQKVDAYQREIRWLGWIDDDAGMLALAKRIEAMPPFDAQNTATQRHEWETRATDARLKPIFVQELVENKERVTRAQRGAHAPTLAAAWMLLGVSEAAMLPFEPTAANVDAMIEAQRKAADAWPEGGMAQDLAGSLVLAAIHRAAADAPALRKAWDADSRTYGSTVVLRRALLGPDRDAVTAALRARPELGEAARLRKQRAESQLGAFDVVLAQLVGDADLEKAARAGSQREVVGAELAIQARLLPELPREKAELDAFREGAKAP